MTVHVVCGPIAADRILLLDSTFDQHLLPDHLSRLSVVFLVPTVRESWGGTRANIAYALAQLGEPVELVGAIGHLEAEALLQRWKSLGIGHQQVGVVPGHSAMATILTDLENNQITGFHPGAMSQGLASDVLAVGDPSSWTIVAPDDPLVIRQHVQRLVRAHRRFLFDPGQALPLLGAEFLDEALGEAHGVLVNDYELSLLTLATGQSAEHLGHQMGQRGGALIVTHGKAGSALWTGSAPVRVPAAHAQAVVDPTGCGDAFRAGLLCGLARHWPWARSAAFGAEVAAIQVAHTGSQNYQLPAGFLDRWAHANG